MKNEKWVKLKAFGEKTQKKATEIAQKVLENRSLTMFLISLGFGAVVQIVIIAPASAKELFPAPKGLLKKELTKPLEPNFKVFVQEFVNLEKWRVFIRERKLSPNSRATLDLFKNKIQGNQPIIWGTIGCGLGCYLGTLLNNKLFVGSGIKPIVGLPGQNLPKIGLEGIKEEKGFSKAKMELGKRKERLVIIKPKTPVLTPEGLTGMLHHLSREADDYIKNKNGPTK